MSAFNELWEASKKGKLLLVDGGMCLFNRRKKDDVIVIYAILVLPELQGKRIGSLILAKLEKMKPSAIEAKCPEGYESNGWYARVGFKLTGTEEPSKPGGPKINLWRLSK